MQGIGLQKELGIIFYFFGTSSIIIMNQNGYKFTAFICLIYSDFIDNKKFRNSCKSYYLQFFQY